MYESNYDKLSESKQNILDEKYNCNICEEDIKEEKPLLCYRCHLLLSANEVKTQGIYTNKYLENLKSSTDSGHI